VFDASFVDIMVHVCQPWQHGTNEAADSITNKIARGAIALTDPGINRATHPGTDAVMRCSVLFFSGRHMHPSNEPT
jgi:hypothetical protein